MPFSQKQQTVFTEPQKKKERTKLKKQLSVLSKGIEEAQKQQSEHEDLSKDIEKLKKNKTKLKKEYEKERKALDKFLEEKNKHTKQLTDAKKALSTAKKSKQKVAKQEKELKKNIKSLEESVEELIEKEDGLKSAMLMKTTLLEQKEEEILGLAIRCQEIREEAEDAHLALALVKQELSGLAVQSSDKREEIQKLDVVIADIATKKKRLKELDGELRIKEESHIKKLEDAEKKYKEGRRDYVQTLEAREGEIAFRASALESKEKKLKQYKAEMEKMLGKKLKNIVF